MTRDDTKTDSAADLRIEARGVSKRFRNPRNRRNSLKAILSSAFSYGGGDDDGFWALHDVDLSVRGGSALGIVGHNGAGKSTLLRLISGVGRPSAGTIRRRGRLAGILTLAVGFHGDLTGRESAVLGGILTGLTASEARAHEDSILDFAELREVADHPMRTYSVGMYMRLAFATAIASNPSILVIDEVLAVGDAAFQEKCLRAIEEFRAGGGTLIVTSHVPEHLQRLCDEVLVLADGSVALLAPPAEGLAAHAEILRSRSERHQGPRGESRTGGAGSC